MSQIIPLGIGSPAEIPQLVLTGLSPGVLPPPPTPGSGGEFQIIGPGDVAYSFNNVESSIFTDGVEFSLSARACQITWQTSFASAPGVTSIIIQVSLDGNSWSQVDVSTNVSGEIRTFATSALFIRAAMLIITPGILTSVSIRMQPLEWLN